MTKPQPKKIASEMDHKTSEEPGGNVLPEVVIVSTTIGEQREATEIMILDTEIKSEEIIAIEQEIESLPDAYMPAPPIYPSSWYAANGIPTCPACGEKYRTDRSGLPLCPVGAVNCPRQL